MKPENMTKLQERVWYLDGGVRDVPTLPDSRLARHLNVTADTIRKVRLEIAEKENR